MDFPNFYIDHLAGGRLLIGIVATLHVLINHPLAVGAYPLLTYLEWWAHKNERPDIDQLAYGITFIVFIATTTVGAMTGVGIWLVTSLLAPFGIGSLLRVFFFGWFLEWLVFISEVGLILLWFLSWKTSINKKLHIKIGAALSCMSWITMALIVAVLDFMMKPGDWNQTRAFIDAMSNPLYAPQLGFRTFFALMTGAIFIWFASFFFTKEEAKLRAWLVHRLSYVTLVSLFFTLTFGTWYWNRIPDVMKANSSVAILTQQFMSWHGQFYFILGVTVIAFLVISIVGILRSTWVPRFALLLPTIMGIWLLSHFERSREFMRKPWIIGDYLYSNGVRKDELEFLQSEGILKHATFVKYHEVTTENQLETGKDLFMLACSRCHSTTGLNGVVEKFTTMYGDSEWNEEAMLTFIRSMHNSRTFMPPFPGNKNEAQALVTYLKYLQKTREPLVGAQSLGAEIAQSNNHKMRIKLVPVPQNN